MKKVIIQSKQVMDINEKKVFGIFLSKKLKTSFKLTHNILSSYMQQI